MINIEELKADRAAGTQGDWEWVEAYPNGFTTQWRVSPGVLTVDGSDGTPGGDGIDRANASRIARLPQLEAAYIEAVEHIERLVVAIENMT